MDEKILEPTPSQTIGPFFHDALLSTDRSRLVPTDHPEAIRVYGTVYDGAGEPVTDAMVEVWQADGAGRYDHPADDREGPPPEEGFSGFGRTGTADGGRYEIVTVKPGAVSGPGGEMQAPHLNVSVFARGLLRRLITRLYFADERGANATDPVLAAIEDPDHRATLLAEPEDGGYRLDIHLQGEQQTVFFDV
jgi:protocatechuate 3,4-dioxygenase alpha subunit